LEKSFLPGTAKKCKMRNFWENVSLVMISVQSRHIDDATVARRSTAPKVLHGVPRGVNGGPKPSTGHLSKEFGNSICQSVPGEGYGFYASV
jgi:hypothetical protein